MAVVVKESWFARKKTNEQLRVEIGSLNYKLKLKEEEIHNLKCKIEKLHDDIHQLERDLNIAEFKNDYYENRMKGERK